MRTDMISGAKRIAFARPRRGGFTLIEILVVVTIIIILLYAVIAIGSNIRASSMTRATQATLHALAAAASEYKSINKKEPGNNYGYFDQFKGIPSVLKNLNRLPQSAWGPTSILDAWGNQIKYVDAATAQLPDGYF